MEQDFDVYEEEQEENWKTILRAIFMIKEKKKREYPQDYIA